MQCLLCRYWRTVCCLCLKYEFRTHKCGFICVRGLWPMRSTHVGRVCVQIVYKCSSSSSNRKNIRWRRCLAADMLTNMRAQNSVMQGCTRTTLILPHIAYSCACACVEYAHTPAYAECIRAYIAHNYYSTTFGGRAHSVHNCFTMAFSAVEMFECCLLLLYYCGQ